MHSTAITAFAAAARLAGTAIEFSGIVAALVGVRIRRVASSYARSSS